ncbi:MAG: tRNA lysidine(34) synthetase TilS [Chloroflexota bacterium]
MTQFILKKDLFLPGEQVVLAVSGGADSMALLDLMTRLRETLPLGLIVATFDHGIRQGSAEDVAFVVRRGTDYGLPVVTGAADVPALARQHGLGLEAAARQVRYDFLAAVAREHSASRVVTAHHADDQAETVMLHVIRGTGVHGLSGMRAISPLPGAPDLRLVRPLLHIDRAALRSYLEDRRLQYREDPTNADLDHIRNYLRHTIIPELENINPAVTSALGRLADAAARDDDLLDKLTEAEMMRLWRQRDGYGVLARSAFNRLHEALRYRVLIAGLLRVVSQAAPTDTTLVEAVRLASYGDTGAQAQFPCGGVMLVDYDRLIVGDVTRYLDDQRQSTLQMPPGTVVSVCMPDDRQPQCKTPVPGVDWALVLHMDAGRPARAALQVQHNAVLTLRTRLPGDRLAPSGMGGHTRKLKDWLIDRKVPQVLRDGLPLLLVDDEIAVILYGDEWVVTEHYAIHKEKPSKGKMFVNFS